MLMLPPHFYKLQVCNCYNRITTVIGRQEVFISQRVGKLFSNRLSCSERSSLWRWLHRVAFKSADLRPEMISPAAWQLERHVVMVLCAARNEGPARCHSSSCH